MSKKKHINHNSLNFSGLAQTLSLTHVNTLSASLIQNNRTHRGYMGEREKDNEINYGQAKLKQYVDGPVLYKQH